MVTSFIFFLGVIDLFGDNILGGFSLIKIENHEETAKNPFIRYESHYYDPNKKVYLYCCEFDVEQYNKVFFDYFQVPFPREIQRAVKKRQAEFLAGRYLAHKAVKKLGVDVSEITTDIYRAPRWPENVIGTISHTHSVAICAASLKKNNIFLGIDIEEYITIGTAKTIKSQVLDEFETKLISSIDMKFEHAVTLCFSAKESLFKAFYPLVNEYFGFEVVKVYSISDTHIRCGFTREFVKRKSLPYSGTLEISYLNYNYSLITFFGIS